MSSLRSLSLSPLPFFSSSAAFLDFAVFEVTVPFDWLVLTLRTDRLGLPSFYLLACSGGLAIFLGLARVSIGLVGLATGLVGLMGGLPTFEPLLFDLFSSAASFAFFFASSFSFYFSLSRCF